MGAYQPLLWGLNLLLLCASTAMLYLGSVLVNFYLLPSLWLFSENFATVPHLIIAIGVMLFFFSIFGFVAAASKNRILLAVYAGLMGVVFLLQLASIFTSIDFRNELDVERVLSFQHSEVDDDMAAYWTDPEVGRCHRDYHHHNCHHIHVHRVIIVTIMIVIVIIVIILTITIR